jgi:carboxylesterase
MRLTDPESIQNPQLDPGPQFHSGNKVGILLFHGYTATPVEVSLLAGYLSRQGYTVSCPLLPGHGTTIDDLHHSTRFDWTHHAEQAFQDLKTACSRCFVGGVSLGGLLSLYLGARRPDIDGIMVYSPALYTRSRLAFLAHLLKYFVKAIPKVRKRNKNSTVDDRWQGYTLESLPAISQLLMLQRQIRRDLPLISQPIIIFQGMLDETIDHKGSLEIYQRVGSREKIFHWMEESSHSLLLDIEWEEVAKMTVEFIDGFLPN